MTQINITVNQRELEFLIKKLKLNVNSHLSLAVQTKYWLLQEENVQDIKEENQILKNQILRAKIPVIAKMEMEKLRNIELDNEIKERTLSYHKIFDSAPSKQAERAISNGLNNPKPVDENSLRCPDCSNFQTNSRQPIEWQIDYLTKHVQNFHKRDFTESEADEIAELIK